MTETILTEKTIDNIVNELVNSVAGNHELGQLGNRVDLQGAGYRTASWVTETNTDLGNTTIVVPNPHEYTDLRVSPIQGAATSLVQPKDEMILITCDNPSNDFSPVNGYAFFVSRDGNITSYQTVTIDFLRNTVTKTSERTECPAVYREHVGKLISETYAEVQKKVEIRRELLKYMPHLAETGFSSDSDLDISILECFRRNNALGVGIADVAREVAQLQVDHEQYIAHQKVEYLLSETRVTESQPHPTLTTNYFGIGSALVIGALLAAVAIRKFYHKK